MEKGGKKLFEMDPTRYTTWCCVMKHHVALRNMRLRELLRFDQKGPEAPLFTFSTCFSSNLLEPSPLRNLKWLPPLLVPCSQPWFHFITVITPFLPPGFSRVLACETRQPGPS
jgi:hypothetical protein